MGWRAKLACAVAVVLVACDGGSAGTNDDGGTPPPGSPPGSPPGTPPASGSWAGVCDRAAQRAVACDAGAFDRAACDAQAACYPRVLRPELVGPLGECVASRPCTESDDKCVADAAQPYVNDPAASQFRDACLARRQACNGGFVDDYCGEGALFSSTVLAAWNDCLSKACGDIRACFDAAGPGCK